MELSVFERVKQVGAWRVEFLVWLKMDELFIFGTV